MTSPTLIGAATPAVKVKSTASARERWLRVVEVAGIGVVLALVGFVMAHQVLMDLGAGDPNAPALNVAH